MSAAPHTPAYEREYYQARERWLDWRIERDQLIALARVGPGVRVLDMGAGAGGLSAAIAARGARVVGVETNAAAAAMMHARLPAAGPARVSEAQTDLPFRARCFDALVAQHVIEHLAAPEAAALEWRRVIKPGGRVAVATPNRRYPDPAHFDDPHHARIYSAEALTALFSGAGFAVEQVFTLFPYLPTFPGRGRVTALVAGVCRRLPYFGARGRTLMLAARRL